MPVLRYWDGSAWVDLGGSSAPEVYVGIDPPASRTSQVLWVDTDDTAPGLIGQRWSPQYTVDSGTIPVASQAPAATYVVHNLGVTQALVVGHAEDGSWAHQCGWRAALSLNRVDLFFYNPGPASAQVILKFRLLY